MEIKNGSNTSIWLNALNAAKVTMKYVKQIVI